MPRKKQATVTQPVPVVFPVDGKTIFTTFDTTIQRHLIVCDNCGIAITLSLTRHRQEADDSRAHQTLSPTTTVYQLISRNSPVAAPWLLYCTISLLILS